MSRARSSAKLRSSGTTCLYQGVTLGGVSTNKSKRHPTIRNHVVVGCNAFVLVDIVIRNNVRISAESMMLKDAFDDCTVVGIPGKIVRKIGLKIYDCDLMYNELPDLMLGKLAAIEAKIRVIRAECPA